MGSAALLYEDPLVYAPQQGTGTKKRVVVFVHGLGSSPACWDSFTDLFSSDPSIAGTFRLDQTFQYPTARLNFSPLTRIPRLQECADALGEHLRRPEFSDCEITIVGHSLGGLVIQAYLAKAFRELRRLELKNIRQAILIATPHRGSDIFAFGRNFLSRIFKNPQEIILRVLNPEIHDVIEEFRQGIANWPITVRCFWGMQDKIVPEASARGPHSEASPLEGDHFTILTPRDQSDPRYSLVAEAIKNPTGHPSIFEIDVFEMELTVQPFDAETGQPIQFGRNGKSKIVFGDNKADVIHRVTFSRNNRCSKPYKMRYRTRREGAVVPHTSHPNLADAQELGLHDDHGCDHVFKFIPDQGSTYAVHWEVYKGFDPGNRDFHFHFNKPEARSHYRHFVLRLNLTAFLSRAFKMTMLPALYYHAQEPTTCEECATLPLIQPLPYSFDEAGIWQWQLNDVREGVVTIKWDLGEGQ